jgi:hypothetical protein
MTQEIKNEITEYVFESLDQYTYKDFPSSDALLDTLHQELFNNDYYIIGYYACEEWLKEHDISVFDAQNYCSNAGGTAKFDNAEQLVNELVYWISLDTLYELQEKIYEQFNTLKNSTQCKSHV